MRITNSMMISNTIWNLNKNSERVAKAQEKMSTQSKIQLPSDDPIIATRAIKYRNYVAQTEQYQKNVGDVISWQQVSENALSDLGDVMKQVRELTVQASSDSLADEDRQQIKLEVAQLKEQAIQIMNTSYAGRYVFGGFSTDEAPYKSQTVTIGDQEVKLITFKGQYLNLEGTYSTTISDTDLQNFYTANSGNSYQNLGKEKINYNIGYGNQITVNVEGQDITGYQSSGNIFQTFDKLLLGLDGAASYKTVVTDPAVSVEIGDLELTNILDDIDNDLDRIQGVRSDLGARTSYAEITKDRLSKDLITYTELMSNNEDVDIAEVSTELSTAEYVYEASLSIGAKVIGKSLIDFLS